MNINLNKDLISIFSNMIAIIAGLCIVYIPLMMFLDSTGLEKISQKDIAIKYYRLNINKIFIKPPPPKVGVVEKKKEPTLKLTQFILKAIYFNENQVENTFIIIKDKKNHRGESIFLNINEKLQDVYTFVDIDINTSKAIFDKDGTKYSMQIDKIKDKVISKPIPSKEINQKSSNAQKTNIQDSILSIPKEKILKYRNDYKSIWKQISIKEAMKDGKIIGFRIRKIKENTLFSKLGLRKDDIITHVNDKPLKSYGDAFKIYYNIDNIRRLKLSISRQSEVIEIDYEVY